MIAIADSGATKTDWVFISENGEQILRSTIGFNPYFIDKEEILEEVRNKIDLPLAISVRKVFFYGAGCSTRANRNRIYEGLRPHFENAETIDIYHDLLGAARALFNNKAGLVCILGTGSNSCFYDGQKITDGVPSLGYLLSDEGSGAYLGKLLVREAYIGSMPINLKITFEKMLNTNLETILSNVYHKPFPNRYLASFTRFLSDHIKDPFIEQLIIKGFSDYFEWQVKKYPQFPDCNLGAVGSVAYIFREQLREVASNFQAEISHIIKEPIQGLVRFHFMNTKKL